MDCWVGGGQEGPGLGQSSDLCPDDRQAGKCLSRGKRGGEEGAVCGFWTEA